MTLVTILSDRVGVLEADLTKTKQTYSSAYTKLILRVKKLEALTRLGRQEDILDCSFGGEDDSSKQGRKFSKVGFKEDEGVGNLVIKLVLLARESTDSIEDQMLRNKGQFARRMMSIARQWDEEEKEQE
ncbi:hypothetical protein Tco_0005570 [Tanacetum coccineum]